MTDRELVNIPEIARRLPHVEGVKPVKASMIRHIASHDPKWPKPAFQRGRVRVYWWDEVVHYFQNRVTRQGERTDLKPRKPNKE